MNTDYSDIIDLPHHQSSVFPHMSDQDRAAQFSPFAALVGYDDMIEETARLTDEKRILSDEEKTIIDQTLAMAEPGTGLEVTYFIPDERKSGGRYVEYKGELKRIDSIERTLAFRDGKRILIDDVSEIQVMDL